MSQTGRCLCGAISYTVEGDIVATAVCHCEHCQRQSGSAFSVNAIVLDGQLKVSGSLGAYDETGESGGDTVFVRRKFCRECGSPIVSELVQVGLLAVKAGTLDDRSGLKPEVEVWCVDRQPWVDLPGMSLSMDREA